MDITVAAKAERDELWRRGLKRCSKCRGAKAPVDFHKRTGSWQNLFSSCKACVVAQQAEYLAAQDPDVIRERKRRSAARYRAAHPEVARNYYRRHDAAAQRRQRLWTYYRLTIERHDEILERQGGMCGICRRPEPGGKGTWNVDHDHACCPGQRSCGACVRGLLCQNCNTGLGLFSDDSSALGSAIAYLNSYRLEAVA